MPKCIIFLINGWDSSAGGIQTVNRELVSAIAKQRPELSCIVIVPTATTQEINAAFSRGVNLIAGNRENDWSSVLLSRKLRDTPPADVVAVVGHSYFTGREAIDLRDNIFPSSLSVQFVHTSPLHLESIKEHKQDSYVKDREAKVARELEIAARADLVICIGPRLHRAMHDLITARGSSRTKVRAINCGISRAADPLRTPPIRPTLLSLGRTESIGVKGLDFFAYAAGYLSATWQSHPSTRERPTPQFVVRGVQGDEESFERRLINLAEEAGARPTIITRPYTAAREELESDYRGATAFLMPSREEGFGLVACEAISQGVPTLVSENSGIAEVIRDAAIANHMDASHCVIPMVGDAKAIGKRYADAALEILVHEQRAASFANMLSERLLPICSWDVGARQFMTAMDEATQGLASSASLKSRSISDKQPVAHDAIHARDAAIARFANLPGLLTIGIQQVVVVTFERGCIPADLPCEIDGIPLLALEGDPIQQTADFGDQIAYVVSDGERKIGTGSLLYAGTKRTFVLTAAHVVQLGGDNLKVGVGSEVYSAQVERIDSGADWALLSLPFIENAQPIGLITDPVPGQAVKLRMSDSLSSGTIGAILITLNVSAPGGIREYRDLFEVRILQDIPPGSSGALVLSEDGSAIGMVVAGSRGGDKRLFAIPMRLMKDELGLQLFKSEAAGRQIRVAMIPTDEESLQSILNSLRDVERFTRHSRLYFKGWLDGELPIVVAPVPRIGNIGAAAATTALVLDNDVTKIFVVGLCGGLNPRVQLLTDVVISTDVIYYERGAVTAAGQQQRLRISGATPPSILKYARELAQEYKLRSQPPVGIHLGSIASGEKIIGSDLSEAFSSWRNVVAVDMEGAGVFEAAAALGQDASITIVRGIADFADSQKRSEQAGAAQNAARVALDLIRRVEASGT